MHFFSEYGMFLAKTVTLVIALLILVTGIIAIAVKNKLQEKDKGQLLIKNLNAKFSETQHLINSSTLDKTQQKKALKAEKSAKKIEKQKSRKRLFVLHFNGDIKASAVTSLCEEINAILLAKKADDEVLLCLDSPGGIVNAYGLAASQLQRLKEANVKLTVAIDKIAASGGYMMAATADYIIAAPFAIIGSIGVVTQLPNFHRFLKKHHIDYELQTAGEYKRTLTLFGENTDKGREKLQEEIESLHQLFKHFIRQHRAQVEIEQVATGEYWFASRAIDLHLIDKIATSDDFLLTAKNDYDLYEIKYVIKKTFGKRVTSCVNTLFYQLFAQKQAGSDYL